MRQENILSALNELEGGEARAYFQSYLRQSIRETIVDLMMAPSSFVLVIDHLRRTLR